MIKRTSKGGNYEIGRGRPPKNTQFKPGQSGNPKGRPKGVKGPRKSLRDALDAALTEPVHLRTERGPRVMGLADAFLLTLGHEAIKGNKTAQRILADVIREAIRREEPQQLDNPPSIDDPAEEQRLLDDFLRRHGVDPQDKAP